MSEPVDVDVCKFGRVHVLVNERDGLRLGVEREEPSDEEKRAPPDLAEVLSGIWWEGHTISARHSADREDSRRGVGMQQAAERIAEAMGIEPGELEKRRPVRA